MSTVSSPPTEHMVLEGIRWETYESLLRDLAHRRLRLSYDRGVLEIMSPSQRHERRKALLRRMVEAMTEELGIPICSAGSTTWKRRDLEKGLEPDECYWVQHEAAVRDLDEVDLLVHPPPDLAIEVDVHSSSVDRMGIYAALGVPEVWRHAGDRLSVSVLENGRYVPSDRSRAFPPLPIPDFAAWLGRREGRDETTWIRAFRAWVRDALA